MVFGGGCSMCYKDPEGIKIDEATCPCGRGYITKDGLFVNGRRVKEGRVPAKKDYDEHIRLCRQCRNGSHDCFWSDEPEDYNSFFVLGAGISLGAITKYNENHGGPHAAVRPAQFEGNDGFLVKSRVKYTESMKEELRRLSAEPRRSDVAGDASRESSAATRDHAAQSRQEPVSRRDVQQRRPTAEGTNDPRKPLADDMNALRMDETSTFTTTPRSNPIFPREERERISSGAETFAAHVPNVSTSSYRPLPSSYDPQTNRPTSFGPTSQTSSRQPTSQIQPQYSTYTYSQAPITSATTSAPTAVGYESTQAVRSTTRVSRDQQSRRDGSSGRTGPVTSRKKEQSPPSRKVPRRDSHDNRGSEIEPSASQTSSHRSQYSHASDPREHARPAVPRDPQRRESYQRSERQTDTHPIFRAQDPQLPSQAVPTRPSTDIARDNPATYPPRRPSEQREQAPEYHSHTYPTSRRQHDDETVDSRNTPTANISRRRDSTREERPSHESRRISVDQRIPRTVPRSSRTPHDEEEDDGDDADEVSNQPTGSRGVEPRRRRDTSEREGRRR